MISRRVRPTYKDQVAEHV